MSTLHNILLNQLGTEFKKEAEMCLEIYDALKEIGEGHVWETWWSTLTTPMDSKTWLKSSHATRYKPSPIGEIFLKGLSSINEEMADELLLFPN
jgi:hypothetical protein|nr:MAG TPA: hypothetical protein [Crassvirales sp.]